MRARHEKSLLLCNTHGNTYGLSTSNTRSYRRHYLAWHSHAVVLADADSDTFMLSNALLEAFTLSRTLARPATAA